MLLSYHRVKTTARSRVLNLDADASCPLVAFWACYYCCVPWYHTDVPLTERGESEARVAGQALRREGFEFDVVYASMLKR